MRAGRPAGPHCDFVPQDDQFRGLGGIASESHSSQPNTWTIARYCSRNTINRACVCLPKVQVTLIRHGSRGSRHQSASAVGVRVRPVRNRDGASEFGVVRREAGGRGDQVHRAVEAVLVRGGARDGRAATSRERAGAVRDRAAEGRGDRARSRSCRADRRPLMPAGRVATRSGTPGRRASRRRGSRWSRPYVAYAALYSGSPVSGRVGLPVNAWTAAISMVCPDLQSAAMTSSTSTSNGPMCPPTKQSPAAGRSSSMLLTSSAKDQAFALARRVEGRERNNAVIVVGAGRVSRVL